MSALESLLLCRAATMLQGSSVFLEPGQNGRLPKGPTR